MLKYMFLHKSGLLRSHSFTIYDTDGQERGKVFEDKKRNNKSQITKK